MCFRNDDPDYPYSCVGTCFVFKFRKRLWGATAKHVLTNIRWILEASIAFTTVPASSRNCRRMTNDASPSNKYLFRPG